MAANPHDYFEPEDGGNQDWSEVIRDRLFHSWIIFKRLWWIIFLCAAVGVGFQAFKEVKKQKQYVSQARMMVQGQLAIPESSSYREEWANFFGTQTELMLSPRIKERAEKRVRALHPNLVPAPVGITAQQQPETSIFLLQGIGPSADYTQAFLEATIQEYLNFRKELRSGKSENALLTLSEELAAIEEQMEANEIAKVEFQKVNNLVFVEEQKNSAGSNLAKLNNQLAELKTQLSLLDSLDPEKMVAPGSSLSITETQSYIQSAMMAASEDFQETEQKLSRLKAELEAFEKNLKPKHPKIIKLKRDIERTENLLEIYVTQAVRDLKDDREALRAQIKNLDLVIDEWESIALENSRKLAEFEMLLSRQSRLKAIHEQLLNRIQSVDLNISVGQETLGVLENATPASLVRSSLVASLIKGFVFGALAGIGIVWFIGMLDNRIISPEDLVRRFDVPIVGVIPIQHKEDGGYVGLLKPADTRQIFVEACRNLRSSLLLKEREKEGAHVYVMTSAIPGEGKSTVSSNLAMEIALVRSKVLLIDADLRRGHLNKFLGAMQSPGFYELLDDKATLDEAIQETGSDHLDFIATGSNRSGFGDLLFSSRFKEIMDELRKRYDYIILDSAPVLATDDATLFSGIADSVLFVVRSNFTQARQVKSAIEHFELRRIQPAGFIVNALDVRQPHYYYYKYDEYYGGESSSKKKGKKGKTGKKRMRTRPPMPESEGDYLEPPPEP